MPTWHLWQWQRFSFQKVAYVILGLYLLITCYTTFRMLNRKLQAAIKDKMYQRIKTLSEIADDADWNPWGEEFESEQQPLRHHIAPALWKMEARPLEMEQNHLPVGKRSPLERKDNSSKPYQVVEIWSKAAIGLYLWEHILGGLLEPRLNGIWSFGEKTVRSIKFRFRTGPGVVPSKVPRDTENLLLVLNGREASKVEVSKMWLESLPSMLYLHNVAVLLLGNERCDNSWIHPYMSLHGGLIKFVFLVYDSPEVDNINFFQWPLGVATYRDFPLIDPSGLPLNHKRPFTFNFLGTVYRNSSREILLSAVNASMYRHHGYMKPRIEWLPQETEETRDEYLRVLSRSDLTLSPVGINTECYRIYESMALGTVPVIEDVMTPGLCGDAQSVSNPELIFNKSNPFLPKSANPEEYKLFKRKYSAPLRLLKDYEAPVIFIKDWKTDLDVILKKESLMSDQDRVTRREHVVQWYEKFKTVMKEQLVSVLLNQFFHLKPR